MRTTSRHVRRLPAAVATLVVALLLAVAVPASADPRGIEDACPSDAEDAFADDGDSPHEDAINCAAHWDIARGVSGSQYAPDRIVTRGQMATFIVRMMQVAGYSFSSSPPNAFSDDNGHTHEANINRLAAADVVDGFDDGTFRPNATVTRAQMASFILRALEKVTGTTYGSSADHFSDDDDSVHEDAINALAELDIVVGTAADTYAPGRGVNRGAMAAFILRSGDFLAEQGRWPDPDASYPPS